MSPKASYGLVAAASLLAAAAGFLAANFGGRNEAVLQQQPVARPDANRAAVQLLGLSLPDASGAPQRLAQWKGKILVANFWATWCLPCREEMPGFSRLNSKYASKGVQFVGIAFDSADKVKEFSELTPVSYPLLIGGSGLMSITADLGDAMGGLPFTVIIGGDGKLVQSRLGLWKESVLDAILADLTH